MHRVLVVGEGTAEQKALAYRLSSTGFETAVTADELASALRSVFAWKPHAIVLDCGLGDSRRELFQLLETVSGTPVIVLGDGAEEELVWFLEEGATDYVVKPVSIMHLAARLKAVLRRTERQSQGGVIRVRDLEIDLDRYLVRRRGRVVPLTRTEFRLLQALAERSGRPCTHKMLLQRVWGEEFAQCTHYLRLYMGYLRQKLEDDPRKPQLLLTERGVGYRLIDEAAEAAAPKLRQVRVATA